MNTPVSSPLLERLQQFLAANPADSFVRYGLAMELGKLGRVDEAVERFRELLAVDPDYVPAYLQAAIVLSRTGRAAEARAVLGDGLRAATRKGDAHAHGEMQGLLAELG